jgi:hypothetical protein
LALYLTVLCSAGLVLSRGKPRGVGRRIPLVFVAIHAGFAWGFLKEVARQVRLRMALPRPA